VSQANLITTFLRMLEAQLEPFFKDKDLYERIDNKIKFNVIGSLYVFSLVWSFGGCLDTPSRKPFDIYAKKVLSIDMSTEKNKKKKLTLPEKGSLFDYGFRVNLDKFTGEWFRWVDTLQEEVFNLKKTPLHQIIVKTADTVRYEFLLEQSIRQ
jgi:dynein heavy chain